MSSFLAAVHAAVTENLSPAAPAALTTETTTMTTEATMTAITTVAALRAAFPDLCAAVHKEGLDAGVAAGASAERARIIGIEAHAMPGHDKLIAEMKADGSVTPDMAAGRILGAEKAARAGQLQGIKDVETVTGAVAAAPSSAPAAPGAAAEKATTPEGWKAEYEASDKLQSEFATVSDYVSLKKAEASGKVRVLGARAS